MTTEYPPFFGGGISTYCFFTAKMLSENGHEVTVFINDNSTSSVTVVYHSSVRIVRFNPTNSKSSSYLGHSACVSYEFAQIIKNFIEDEGKPDIIESQEYLGIAYYLLQFKHLHYDWCKDVPVLITMHSPAFLYLEYNHVPLYKYPNYWIGEMERFCMRAADFVVSPSKYLVDEVSERVDLSSQIINVIPNPFESSNILTEHDVEELSKGIVFFGKLSVQKGTFKLLQYFQNLWDEGFLEPLFLIGGQDIVYHPEGQSMGDLVKSRYSGAIAKGLLHLEEKIEPTKIYNRLRNSKVVIVPSTVDNLPYVVMEIMSIGLIALVSKQGGQSEIVDDGINGFVFDHEIPGSFAKQLKRILNLTTHQRKQISTSAINKINEAFSLDVIYRQKYSLLQKIILSNNESRRFPFCYKLDSPDKREFNQGNTVLSVVVPYYNMGKYIDAALSSIYNSNYKDIEVIIVNDGSTDKDSLEKLNQLINKPNLKVISTPNQGLAVARNTGAQNASGKYLAFLDADDLVMPEYFTKAINVLKKQTNVDFVGCWTQYFEGSKSVWPTFTPEPPLILFHNLINSSSLVYKRDAFVANGLNDPKMTFPGLEDYDSVISLISNGFKGVVLPEILFKYRVRKDSMIRGITKIKKILLFEYLSTKHNSIYTKFAHDVYNLQLSNGPGIHLDNPTLDNFLLENFPFGGKVPRKIFLYIKQNKYARMFAYRLRQFLS